MTDLKNNLEEDCMCDRNPSNELLELLKSQSRSAKDWSYSIAGAFWQNKGQIIDEEYLFICLSNAMMSMHDSIFYNEVKQLENELQKTREQLEKAEKVIEFYGDPEHWILRIGRDAWKSSNPKKHGDSELIRGYNHFNTEWRGSVGVGGKLARQYLKTNTNKENKE